MESPKSTLKAILEDQIHRDSHLMTDSSPLYNVVTRAPNFAASVPRSPATKPGKPSKPPPKRSEEPDDPPAEEAGSVGFDDLLRRMLTTPTQRASKTPA
jgi:hypothetical protein